MVPGKCIQLSHYGIAIACLEVVLDFVILDFPYVKSLDCRCRSGGRLHCAVSSSLVACELPLLWVYRPYWYSSD